MRYLLPLLFLFLTACSETDNEVQPKNVEQEDEVLALFETMVYDEIENIESNLLSLDIYYNSAIANQKPVVIYVHGGGWSIGDKSNQMENKIRLFRELDYVLVSINYRLSPFPYELDNPNRVIFPTHNRDVANAIKWVVDHIENYGGNPNKIGLLGHSAGAHLVSLTGTNPTFLHDVELDFTNIKGIAAIDTEGYDVFSEVQEQNELYINAFGTNSALTMEASPLRNVYSATNLPKFFIAKRGNVQRISIADDFLMALSVNGAEIAQVDGSIYDHSGINQAIGMEGETVITPALIRFFESCFE